MNIKHEMISAYMEDPEGMHRTLEIMYALYLLQDELDVEDHYLGLGCDRALVEELVECVSGEQVNQQTLENLSDILDRIELNKLSYN